jgi:cation/acetate symporter
MRAITWTQVAQYVVILLAFLMPVSWLAYKQLGNPVAAATAQQLGKIAVLESSCWPRAEQEVLEAYRAAPRCCRQAGGVPQCWPGARSWRSACAAAHRAAGLAPS